jgi:hypothetical protein
MLDSFLELGFLDDPLQILGIADGNVGIAQAAVLAEVKPRVKRRLGRPLHAEREPETQASKLGRLAGRAVADFRERMREH